MGKGSRLKRFKDGMSRDLQRVANKIGPAGPRVLQQLSNRRLLVGLGVMLLLLAFWQFPHWQADSWDLPKDTNRANLVSDMRATMVEAVVGLFVLGGLFFAWRNLRALQEQIEVTQTTHAVERFVRLRERAISREHADVERRVAALLRHLDDLTLTTQDLDYAPDINLYLNDYLWIGRFVKHELINEEFARATYGRSLFILYPKLKPYIKNERKRRQFRTLWKDVDWLYRRFRRRLKVLGSSPSDEQVVRREMERWVNPT